VIHLKYSYIKISDIVVKMTRKGFKSILIREEVKQQIEEIAKQQNAKSLCSFISQILSEYIKKAKEGGIQ